MAVEFLAPDDGVEAPTGRPTVGRIASAEPTKPGDEIVALRIRGAGLAHADPRSTVIEIELLDGAGMAMVNVWVANVLPFIVLKSFALRGRTEDKDAFDLVWVLTHWPDGGPEAAARQAIKSWAVPHAMLLGATPAAAAWTDACPHRCSAPHLPPTGQSRSFPLFPQSLRRGHFASGDRTLPQPWLLVQLST